MPIRTEPQPIHIQVLRLRGEVSVEDACKIQRLISEYLKAGLTHVVMNLENVHHVQLPAISILAERARTLRECGGDLKLVGVSRYLSHMWDLAGYSFQFDFCRNEEEAGLRFSNTRVPA